MRKPSEAFFDKCKSCNGAKCSWDYLARFKCFAKWMNKNCVIKPKEKEEVK